MSELILPSRRGFLAGLGALIAAPAIVHAQSLMPIKPLPISEVLWQWGNGTYIELRQIDTVSMQYISESYLDGIQGIPSYWCENARKLSVWPRDNLHNPGELVVRRG